MIVKAKEDPNSPDEEEDLQRLLVPFKSEKDYSIMSGKSPLKKTLKKMTELKLLDIRNEEQKD